ncbi:acetyl-CoA carboxylase biotin carboxylase subunit family protein [Actinomadura sp. BRA 177]|uniref:ATP-grasp domain-containing protein n=1 Tax=Actinomadura sp. BRA 177 TaxID=2745202 RepID=UPI0015951DE3|nr:ATP-grasp domain-containing protein [Actinomadura sp. BRA 177]NVI89398.1 ATP-grasp domain-containing protein [Actinomadura sp. BRA 177]
MPQNVFVLGWDELNFRMLRELPHPAQYRFHRLLSLEELRHGEIDFDRLLDRAGSVLDAFDGPVDAIIGFRDFPITTMVPVLCARYGLRSATLESVVKCEHKYWSRLVQREVIDEKPAFGLVDLEADEARPPPGVRFPMWLKPVKSMASVLAFHVRDRDEFARAAAVIREEIGFTGRPFESVLSRLDLPPEIAEAGGSACLAEESVDGAQLTLEGWASGGKVHVYGAVDSLLCPDRPSFLRYQYPSSLPGEVIERMTDISARVIKHIGLDSTTFNIEFFWDRGTGAINLLEVNPRHSQSHAPLFLYVDGAPNHQYMVRLALGLDPEFRPGGGDHNVAAKWFIRRFTDGVVRRVPSAEEIAAVEWEFPGTIVQISVEPGVRLSDLALQDSYSYELGHIYMGAENERELEARYARCLERLTFQFDE